MKRFVFFIALLLISLPAQAKFFELSDYHTYGPLHNRSQNPLYLLFISDWLETATTLEKYDWQIEFETTFSNIFEWQPQTTGVGIDLDMELIREALNARFGLTDKMELGLQWAFVSFTGGFLDGFIQDYHQAFGFPNGGRENVNNGRFNYQITQNGNSLFEITNASSLVMSDLILWTKYHLLEEQKIRPAIALKLGFKVPTGSLNKGASSNNPDMSFSFLAQKSYKRLHSYSQLGFLLIGGHDVLSPLLKTSALTFAQSFELNVTEHLSFIAQLNGNTSLFKNVSIHELNDIVLDFTLGFVGERKLKTKKLKKLTYQIGFAEDLLAVGPSVDFSVYGKLGVVY